MSKARLFAASLLLTVGTMLIVFYFHRPDGSRFRPKLEPVADGLFVTSQLHSEGVHSLQTRGLQAIVDIRPDGEAPDQPPSQEIGRIAGSYGLQFHYIPVPHGPIPADAVQALSAVLSHRTVPIVLYCRSGSRAVRTFALVEASRKEGPSAEAITKMVKTAGFSADDMQDEIARRIAQRQDPNPEEK